MATVQGCVTIYCFPQGPLVGELQSSQAITAQYAHADPVFVQKTAVSPSAVQPCSALILQALPHKYSHYRTVKGDGNCGWRGRSAIQAEGPGLTATCSNRVWLL